MRQLKALTVVLGDLAICVRDTLMLPASPRVTLATYTRELDSLRCTGKSCDWRCLGQPTSARDARPADRRPGSHMVPVGEPRMDHVTSDNLITASEVLLGCLALALALVIFCITVPM